MSLPRFSTATAVPRSTAPLLMPEAPTRGAAAAAAPRPQDISIVNLAAHQGPAGVGPVIDGIAQHGVAATEAIGQRVDQTDRILAALDTATTAFDNITQGRSGAMHKELVSIVGDIQGVAKEAKIVSFNAQVMAASAGQHGREFAVVANVLSNITDVINGLTRKAAVLAEQRHTLAA